MEILAYEAVKQPGSYLVVGEQSGDTVLAGALRLPDVIDDDLTEWPEELATAIGELRGVNPASELQDYVGYLRAEDNKMRLAVVTVDTPKGVCSANVILTRADVRTVRDGVHCIRQHISEVAA